MSITEFLAKNLMKPSPGIAHNDDHNSLRLLTINLSHRQILFSI